MHVHDLQPFKWAEFNLTHHITRLSFGNDYPGLVNPLDNIEKAEGNLIIFTLARTPSHYAVLRQSGPPSARV
jgi:hypothetical protein